MGCHLPSTWVRWHGHCYVSPVTSCKSKPVLICFWNARCFLVGRSAALTSWDTLYFFQAKGSFCASRSRYSQASALHMAKLAWRESLCGFVQSSVVWNPLWPVVPLWCASHWHPLWTGHPSRAWPFWADFFTARLSPCLRKSCFKSFCVGQSWQSESSFQALSIVLWLDSASWNDPKESPIVSGCLKKSV